VPELALPATRNLVHLAVQHQAVYLLIPDDSPSLFAAPDGIHFARLTQPCSVSSAGEGFSPVALAASSPGDLAVLCGDGAAAGSERKRVFVSSDAGHTFRSVAEPPFSGDVGDIAAATPSTLAITAASGASYVYRTGGADATWTTPLEMGDGGVGWNDLGFTDSSHGVIVYGPAARWLMYASPPNGLGRLFLTDDGGVGWYPVNLEVKH